MREIDTFKDILRKAGISFYGDGILDFGGCTGYQLDFDQMLIEMTTDKSISEISQKESLTELIKELEINIAKMMAFKINLESMNVDE